MVVAKSQTFTFQASLLALLVTYAYAAPQLGALSALADDDIDEPFNVSTVRPFSKSAFTTQSLEH